MAPKTAVNTALLITVLAGAGVIGGVAHADEPLFGYVYTTDLLPKGKMEVEHWDTLREGRSRGDFHVLQDRTEVSYGLTDRLQISGYLNLAYADVRGNAPSGETAPPEIFADYNANPDKSFNHFRLESLSGEVIYRIASPYTSPVGVALYLEPSVGPRTYELESRLILQKNFFDDRLVIAANATIGFEWRRLHGDPEADPASVDFIDHWDQETDVNFGLAASYRFAPKWSAGAEFQNEREWAGLDPFASSKRTNVAWYAGPTLHYATGHYFFTGTFLVQLPWARDYADPPADSFVVHGISNADDFEKYRFRLKVGYYF
jgi:hypothetical protein